MEQIRQMSTLINNLNNPFNVQSNGIVTGKELAQVTSEISFAASQIGNSKAVGSTASIDLSKFKKVDQGLNLFSADADTVRKVAANKAAFDVQISSNALSNLQMLQTEAAKAQASSYITIPTFNNNQEFDSSLVEDEKQESNKKDLVNIFA